MLLDNLPDLVDAKVQISVSGNVPKAIDRSPADLRVSRFERRRELASRLGQGRQTPEDRILGVDIPNKCLAPRAGSCLDQREGVTNVREIAPATVGHHKGMASCWI